MLSSGGGSERSWPGVWILPCLLPASESHPGLLNKYFNFAFYGPPYFFPPLESKVSMALAVKVFISHITSSPMVQSKESVVCQDLFPRELCSLGTYLRQTKGNTTGQESIS